MVGLIISNSGIFNGIFLLLESLMINRTLQWIWNYQPNLKWPRDQTRIFKIFLFFYLVCPWPAVPAAAASKLCWEVRTLDLRWLLTTLVTVCSSWHKTVDESVNLGTSWSSCCSWRLKASKKALSDTDRFPPSWTVNGLRLAVKSPAILATPPVMPEISIEVEVFATTKDTSPLALLGLSQKYWPWLHGRGLLSPERKAKRGFLIAKLRLR